MPPSTRRNCMHAYVVRWVAIRQKTKSSWSPRPLSIARVRDKVNNKRENPLLVAANLWSTAFLLSISTAVALSFLHLITSVFSSRKPLRVRFYCAFYWTAFCLSCCCNEERLTWEVGMFFCKQKMHFPKQRASNFVCFLLAASIQAWYLIPTSQDGGVEFSSLFHFKSLCNCLGQESRSLWHLQASHQNFALDLEGPHYLISCAVMALAVHRLSSGKQNVQWTGRSFMPGN